MFTEPICFKCKNFDINTSTCKAFPTEIPMEILNGENDHSEPLPNQNNDIVFEPIEAIRWEVV
jgi:hypothetical protein